MGGPTPIKIGKPILGGKTENLATNDMYGWQKREHTANHGFEAFPKAAGQKKQPWHGGVGPTMRMN